MMKVFISATKDDLNRHYAAAAEALQKLNLQTIDVTEEKLDKETLRISLAALEAADLFIGIYGAQYGTLLEDQNTSFPEYLYEHARQQGIPQLIYIISPTTEWITDYLAPGTHGALMRMFLERLKTENPNYRTFTTPEDLADKVTFDVVRFRHLEPSNQYPSYRRHILIGLIILASILAVVAWRVGPLTSW